MRPPTAATYTLSLHDALPISAAAEAGKFEFWPKGGAREWLAFTAAFLTLAIGSIPQQDIFQRVTRSEEHTSELQSHHDLVCRLLLEKKKQASTSMTASSSLSF